MRVLAPQDSSSMGAAEMILQAAGACPTTPVDALPDVRFRTSTYFKEEMANMLDTWEYKYNHYAPVKYLEMQWRKANIMVAIFDDKHSCRIKLEENGLDPSKNAHFLAAHAWVGKCKGAHDIQLMVYLDPHWKEHQKEILEHLSVCLSHEWQHLRQRPHPLGTDLNDYEYRQQFWEMEADAFAVKELQARTGADFPTAVGKVLHIVSQSPSVANELLKDEKYLQAIQATVQRLPDYTHQEALMRQHAEHVELVENGTSAAKLLEQTDGHGNTFLHMAAKDGLLARIPGGVAIEQLQTKNEAGDMVLHVVAEHGALSQLTTKFTAKQLGELKSNKETVLHSAVRGACLDQILNGVTVRDLFFARDYKGQSALQLAAGDQKILQQIKLLKPEDVTNIYAWYQAKGSHVTWEDLHHKAPVLQVKPAAASDEVPF